MTQPPIVSTMIAADAASRSLGIELLHAEPGRASTRMVVRDDMVNGHGVAHGAMVFAVADTAFACACNGYETPAVAAGAEVVFAAPARTGDILIATAQVRTRFGRNGIYDVTVRRGDTVVAEFRGHSHDWRGDAR